MLWFNGKGVAHFKEISTGVAEDTYDNFFKPFINCIFKIQKHTSLITGSV